MGCNQSALAADVALESVDSGRQDLFVSKDAKEAPALIKTSRASSTTSADSDPQSPTLDEVTAAEWSSDCRTGAAGSRSAAIQGQPGEGLRRSSTSSTPQSANGEMQTYVASVERCLYCMEQCDASQTCTDFLLGDAHASGDASVLRFWAAATTALHALMVTPPGPLDATATELFSEQHYPMGLSLAARIFDLASPRVSAKMRPQQVFVEIFTLMAAFSVGLNLSVGCLTHAVFLVHRAAFAGLMFTALTFRPILLTALILASKEFHDESLRISDVQRLFLMLDLRSVAQMERRLLRLLDYRVSIAAQRNKQSQFAGHLRCLHLHPVQAVANFTQSSSCLAIQQWVALLSVET